MVSADDILLGLQIAVFIVLLIVLYHVLFAVVNIRKITRRIADVTAQLENVILKPLSVADQALDVVLNFLESKYDENKKAKSKKKNKK